MYLDAKQKVAHAAKTEEENTRLKQRISQLDENAVAREKAKTATAERKAQEQTNRADREEQRANVAEDHLSKMERFVRHAGLAETFNHWNLLNEMVDKAITAFNNWAHRNSSIFNRDDKQVIGQGIVAQCQLNGLNPCKEANRKTIANSIAEMAKTSEGSITQFKWDLAVRRIGQLASEMSVSMGGQSVGGSNGNADELTYWDDTKKKGLGW